MYNYIKENKVKVTAIVVAIVLIVSTFIGTAVYSKGFTQWGNDTSSGLINGDTDIELDSGEIQLLPKSIIATSDNTASVTFTATVTPNNAYDKSLTWVLSWGDSNGWGNGKAVTDYVLLTVDSTNSHIASLSCTEAFGGQIILTVTAVSNHNATTNATIDFLGKATLQELNIAGLGVLPIDILTNDFIYSPDLVSSPEQGLDFSPDEELTLVPKFSYGLGSVDIDIVQSFELSFSDEYYEVLQHTDMFPQNFVGFEILDSSSFTFDFNTVSLYLLSGRSSANFTAFDVICRLFYDYNTYEPLSASNHFQINHTYSVNGGAEIKDAYKFSFDVDSYLQYFTQTVDKVELSDNIVTF